MRILVFCLLMIFALESCRVLSNAETQSTQALAKAMTNCSKLPAAYTKEYYDITLEISQFKAAAIKNPSEKIDALKEILTDRAQAETIVNGYSSGYDILKLYAGLLLAFTDETEYQNNLTNQKNAFIPAFDSLTSKFNTLYPHNKIPITSLGALFTDIFQEVGSRRIRYLQRKYLKDLVENGNDLVSQICDHYNSSGNFYSSKHQLTGLDGDIDRTYKNFVKEVNLDSGNSNTYQFYTLYDPIFLNWKNKKNLINELYDLNARAFSQIKDSHQKLKELLEKKGTLGDLTASLNDLYSGLNTLNESYQKFQKNLTPLK